MVAYKISLYKQILNDPDNIRTYMLAHPTADPATIPASARVPVTINIDLTHFVTSPPEIGWTKVLIAGIAMPVVPANQPQNGGWSLPSFKAVDLSGVKHQITLRGLITNTPLNGVITTSAYKTMHDIEKLVEAGGFCQLTFGYKDDGTDLVYNVSIQAFRPIAVMEDGFGPYDMAWDPNPLSPTYNVHVRPQKYTFDLELIEGSSYV